jgi:hypothetical protein
MKRTIYLVLIFLACFACKKDDPTEELDDDITSDFYFTATIDGVKVLIQEGIDGYANGSGAGGGSTPDGFQQEQGAVFLGLPNGYVAVVILKTFPERPDQCSQMDGMFHIGSYPFGQTSRSTEEDGKDGVAIFYMDADGVYWSSDYEPATQSGSSFEITEYTDFTTMFSSKIMKAKFNCTLYDGEGHSKTLTNGEIRSKCLYCN